VVIDPDPGVAADATAAGMVAVVYVGT